MRGAVQKKVDKSLDFRYSMDKECLLDGTIWPESAEISFELMFFCVIVPKKLIKVLLKQGHFVIIIYNSKEDGYEH